MLRSLYQNVKRLARKAVAIGMIGLATCIPGKAYAQHMQASSEKPRVVYAQKGQHYWGIAKNYLKSLGVELTNEKIGEQTDSIAAWNNKGIRAEYPFQEPYNCRKADEKDPNCIEVGEPLYLERIVKQEASQETPNQPPEENPYSLLLVGLGLVSGAGIGRAIKKREERKKRDRAAELDSLVKEANPYKSLDAALEEAGEDPESFCREFYELYREGYISTPIARYDHSRAPEGMKNEMLGIYKREKDGREMTLEQASEYLTRKYGMHVSASTISKRAREALGVKNRKEAKRISEPRVQPITAPQSTGFRPALENVA